MRAISIRKRGYVWAALLATLSVATLSVASVRGAVDARRSASSLPTAPDRASIAPNDTVTQLQMRGVDFYVDRDIPLRIRRLRGTMRSKTGGPIMFDDKSSYIIHLDVAEIGLTGKDLSGLLNKYVLAYPGAPLKRLSVSTEGNEIVQKGILHKVLDLPFEIRATLSVTPEGRIRIHPTRTEILGMHMDQVMKGLGLALDKIISLRGAKGASLDGNDILLEPDKILPPPTIEGRVTSIRVERDQVVQVFGQPSSAEASTLPVPDTSAAHYMFYKGGTLRFGKLLMLDAEMLIVDVDPSDPFRFDLDRYQSQLVAGYSRTLPSGGLEVYMPDIEKVGKTRIQVTAVPVATTSSH